MKILITGATGFIGRHLCNALKDKFEIFALLRKTSTDSPVPESHSYCIDDDVDRLINFIKENDIKGVIHLATKYVAEHRPNEIKDLIQSNIYLSTIVLEAACKGGVDWFINTGTIWQNYNVPDFSDEYCPVNLYAASKQAFQTIAKFYTEVYPIKFCTLKLCDTYGPGDNRKKIMDLFYSISKSGEYLDMSPGEQLIDIVHVNEVIKSFTNLIECLISSQDIRKEYVVTSNKLISLRELADQFEKDHNVRLNINWGARPYRKREVMRPYKGFSI